MSRHKRKIFDELIDEIRRSQAATQRFDQAVADALGLNRTDMRCVDVLQRAGQLTAGQLAEQTGLSTAAMTTALDRLERLGYARRVRDTHDRRRVMVEITEHTQTAAGRFYAEHGAKAEQLYNRYSTEELELLLAFIREGREFNEARAVQVEQQTRRHER